MKTKKVIIFILCGLIVGVSIGFAFGVKIGYKDGSQTTTTIRNQMLDIQPYDASLEIKDLEYSDISPSGFTIKFNTNKTTGTTIYGNDVYDLACEWAVYPSDIFIITPISVGAFVKPSLRAIIETYPEGGTVMFRIIREDKNIGSLWFYIDLPHPDNATLPPPYMPNGESE